MASNSYGYMAKIGVDTSGMRQADSDMRNISRELREVNNLIEQTGGTTELYAQRQQLLADQVNRVSGNLQQLRNHQAQVRQAFESGTISAEMYRAFQRDIVSAEASLEQLEDRQNRVSDAMNRGGDAALTLGDIIKGDLISGGVEKLAGLLKDAASALVDFAREGVELSSDLTEVQNVVDVTFGENSSIYDFADTAAEKFGMTKLAAEQYAGTMGAMLKSSGINEGLEEMSITIASLAGDMASFYNISSDIAFDKLRSGISGETEPLKQLGINMSVVNLEAYALSQGIEKSWKSMSQAEQTMLRYNYILDQTKDAQGDFERTSDSLANQQRILELNLDNVKIALGEKLLPLATEIFSAINDNMPAIEEAARYLGDEFTEALGGTIEELIKFTAEDGIPAVIEALKWLIDNGDTVVGILEALATAWAVDKAAGFVQVIAGIPGAIGTAVGSFGNIVSTLNSPVSTAFANLQTTVQNSMTRMTTAIQAAEAAAGVSFASIIALAAAAAAAIGSMLAVADELNTIADGMMEDSKEEKQSKENVAEIQSGWDEVKDKTGLERYEAALDYRDDLLERQEDWNKRYKAVNDELSELEGKTFKTAAETARMKELQATQESLDAEWAMIEAFGAKVDNELAGYSEESIRGMERAAGAQEQSMANIGRTNEDALADVWDGIRKRTDEKMKELDDLLATHQITEEEYWARRKEWLEAHRDEESKEWWEYYDEVTEYYDKAAKTEETAANKAADSAEKTAVNNVKRTMENLKRVQQEQGLSDEWLMEQYRLLADSLEKGTDAYYAAYDAYLDMRDKVRDENDKQDKEDQKQREKAFEDEKKDAENRLDELKKQHDEEVKQKKKEAEDNLSLLRETQEGYARSASEMSERVTDDKGKERLVLQDYNKEVQRLKKYRESMEKLKSLGLSEELMASVNSFSYEDGSRQMYIDELLKMRPEKREQYDREYRAYISEQKKTAEYDTGLSFEDEEKSLLDASNGVLDEASETAYEYGKKAGELYIKGMEDIFNSGGVIEAVTMKNPSAVQVNKSGSVPAAAGGGNVPGNTSAGIQGVSPKTAISINIAGTSVIRTTLEELLRENILTGGAIRYV